MPLFIVANDAEFSKPLILDPEDEHHLKKSLRARIGDEIRLTNNSGKILLAKITRLDPLLLETKNIFTKPAPKDFCVALPLIDFQRLEWAVEKLTELNILKLQLLLTERTQIKTLSPAKKQRLERVAFAAQKQSERAFPFNIADPISLTELAKNFNGKIFYGDTEENNSIISPPKKNLSEKRTIPCLLVIGPEGGFSENERQLLKNIAAEQIFRDGNILRSETAAVVLASTLILTL